MSIVQKVLANPGKYSIQQLQQAVQSGVLPAYIAVPIIQSKVQAEKQAQMAQAMQQPPAQQQTPVAERVMAEARGLEALPTALPTQYASGGIVAFDEGGSVPRYQSRGLVTQPMTQAEREEQARRDRASFMLPFAAAGDIVAGPYNYLAQTGESAANALGIPRLGRALGIYDPDVSSVRIPRIGQGGDTPLTDKLRAYAAAPAPAATPAPAAPAAPAPAAKAPPAPAPTDKRAPAPAADADTADSGIGIGGKSALGRGPGLGLKPPEFNRPRGKSYEASAMEYYDEYGEKAKALDKETEEKIKAANESVKGKAFDEYKKSLEKEALEAGAERNQAKYMAMFKAGLAMMAGTSQHAFENIGKGALAGAEDYQAAVKELKKAERERRKEFAYIEQAQRAEALGDRDKAVARLEKAQERADARMRYIGEGIYRGTTLDKQQAYDIAKTQFGSTSDIFRTDLAGRYQLAGVERSAEARLAALALRAGAGADRGQMNQKQVGDALLQLQQHPDAIAYRKQLIDKFGKNSANTPEFQQAMDKFVGGLFQKFYGNTTRGGTGLGGSAGSAALEQLMSDPSIAPYLKP